MAIVYGLFPYPPNHSDPGPEPHPCLVLDVFEDEETEEPWVIVAFGTSKNTDQLYSGEFLVNQRHSQNDGSGLDKPTKFSLARNRLAKLPYNNKFFDIPPARRNTAQKDPLIGMLSSSIYMNALRAAAEGVGTHAIIEELSSLSLGILPAQ